MRVFRPDMNFRPEDFKKQQYWVFEADTDIRVMHLATAKWASPSYVSFGKSGLHVPVRGGEQWKLVPSIYQPRHLPYIVFLNTWDIFREYGATCTASKYLPLADVQKKALEEYKQDASCLQLSAVVRVTESTCRRLVVFGKVKRNGSGVAELHASKAMDLETHDRLVGTTGVFQQ